MLKFEYIYTICIDDNIIFGCPMQKIYMMCNVHVDGWFDVRLNKCGCSVEGQWKCCRSGNIKMDLWKNVLMMRIPNDATCSFDNFVLFKFWTRNVQFRSWNCFYRQSRQNVSDKKLTAIAPRIASQNPDDTNDLCPIVLIIGLHFECKIFVKLNSMKSQFDIQSESRNSKSGSESLNKFDASWIWNVRAA